MPYNPYMYTQNYQGYQMGPGAPISQPNWIPNSQPQQPIDGLISVTGLEGARAYQLPPNSKMALFDADADVFYVKTTDAGGFPTVRAFSFTPIEQAPSKAAGTDYVPRPEFDRLAQTVGQLMDSLGMKEATDAE